MDFKVRLLRVAPMPSLPGIVERAERDVTLA
jgi:hypothetical protein